MLTVFFSYSHRNEDVRNELETHMALLKRQGIITAWHDRRIVAGDDFAGKISENLEAADVVLLLVSPYFLASDYCYDVEMCRGLERHKTGKARVMPVILDPCDWHSAPFGQLLALPKDGKPISKYPNPHDAFLEIVQEIRKIAGTGGGAQKAPAAGVVKASPAPSPEIRSSNLRVKKTFTDHDRDSFLDDAFEYIAKFFEGSLAELQARNDGITGKFRCVNGNHFTSLIYRNGKSASQCGIRLGSWGGGTKQIMYCSEPDSTNSHNGALAAEDDGHHLFLQSALAFDDSKTLSQHGAAEVFWARLMEPLQR